MTTIRMFILPAVALAVVLQVSCTATEPKKETAQATEVVPEEQLTPRERVRHALDLFQEGRSDEAQAELRQALEQYPGYRLARQLLEQFEVDPEVYLGKASFDYRVQPGESLSLIAKRYLGDPLKFIALARYNQLSEPGRLEAGQVLRIPGDGTVAPAAAPEPSSPDSAVIEQPAVEPEPEPEAAAVSTAEDESRVEGRRLYEAGQAEATRGAYDKAYRMYRDAAVYDPENDTYRQAMGRAGRQLADQYHRKAMDYYHREQLDEAKRYWRKVLEVDPDNRIAPGYLAKVEELQRRMREMDGK